MLRVAIYSRVSTEEQAQDDKLSLRDQEERCREWCAKRGYIVVAAFCDPGVSGGTLERPQLQAALAAARREEYDILLAKCMDRLTRDTDHGGHLATILSANNARLQFVDEDFEQTAIGKLMRTISTWRGEEEREKFRRRATVGRLGRAQAGKVNATTLPYGYRREVTVTDGKKIYGPVEIDDYEAAQLRRMFTWYLHDGLAFGKIARRLNAEKVPMKRGGGKGWLVESVRRLMINERYTGIGWQNMERGEERVPREEWLPVEYPQIIDPETFRRMQERIATNRPFRKATIGEERHLVQGIAFCYECGNRLQCSSQIQAGGLRPIYRCSGQLRRGYDCRRPMKIDGPALDAAVWGQIVNTCRNPELWFDAGAAADRGASLLSSDVESLVRDLEHKLREADEKRSRLAAAVASGLEFGESAIATTLAQIKASEEAWEHDLRRLRARQGEYRSLAIDREHAEALAAEIGPRLDGMVLTEQQELVRALVKRVWLDKAGNVTIEAALPYLERTKTTWQASKSTSSQRAD